VQEKDVYDKKIVLHFSSYIGWENIKMPGGA
jgi:hypothetical protein